MKKYYIYIFDLLGQHYFLYELGENRKNFIWCFHNFNTNYYYFSIINNFYI